MPDCNPLSKRPVIHERYVYANGLKSMVVMENCEDGIKTHEVTAREAYCAQEMAVRLQILLAELDLATNFGKILHAGDLDPVGRAKAEAKRILREWGR